MEFYQKKPSLSKFGDKWVWIAVTAVFCLLFTFALIPGASAQGNISDRQRVSSYHEMMQNVFNFIMQNYVDEVDPLALFKAL